MWAIGTLIAALSVSVAARATDIPIGTFSVYMASASGNQHVKFGWLLPCGDHGYVSIIDSSTNDVVRTIEVGSCPFQVAADPKRPRIYVVHGAPYDPVTFVTQGPGSVWMVDVRNGSVIASLSVGYAPTSIALTSDGEKAYVTNWESDAVSVIDTDAFTVLKTISIEKPTSVAHSPSTPTAYVTSTNGTVTMLDTLTDTATATILVAATAESISVSTDGSIGYVSGAAPSDDAPLTVFELDLAAGRVLDEIRDDADTMYTGFIAMSPDGLFGYSAGDDGTPPTVFDIGRRVFELFDCPKCFLVWKGSGSIAVSPDSATVFTGGWVFDARSRRAVARVDLPAGATGVAVGPSWPITHLEKDRDGCHIHPGTPPNQWMLLPAIACGIARLLGSRRRESRTKVFQPTPKSGAAENWRSAGWEQEGNECPAP